MREIAIGVLGLGQVGSGVLKILSENREALENRLAARLEVKRIVVRDLERPRPVAVDPARLTTRVEDVLEDPDIRVVVELIGGLEPARSWVLAALRAGKHVVTANKAMLAMHGEEIFALAAERRLDVFFEGSVAGGIPVLRSIREGLASDRVRSVTGIVNGTSNFILDRMTREGMDYLEALALAQELGYAEADPTLDVGGFDAAHKLALLSLLSFGMRVDPVRIPTEGISRVRAFDVQQAKAHGFVIRSLAIATRLDHDRLRLRVHPIFVPREHILAGVHDAYNAVMVDSDALGRTLYYGPGAGMMPTGAAVVADIIEVGRDILGFSQGGPPPEAFRTTRTVVPEPLDDIESNNYVCFHVNNVPGVLGRVASTLGRHGVGIERMHQDTPRVGDPMNMVIFTEKVREAQMVSAIQEVDGSGEVLAPSVRLRVFGGEL